jgi:hypothetical protein
MFPEVGCGLLLLAPALCLVTVAGIWSKCQLIIAGMFVTLTYAAVVSGIFLYLLDYLPHATLHTLIGLLGAAVLSFLGVRAIRKHLQERGD